MNTPTDLIDHYASELNFLASRLARRWHLDRDDVRQDLVLLLLIHGGKYDSERGSFSLWLGWQWANLNRKRKKLSLIEDVIIDVLSVETSNPAMMAATNDDIIAVRKAVAKLPSLDRNVLCLNYGLDGRQPQKFEEIAQQMRITPQWAYQRRIAGIEKLRYMLDTN